jgi:ABC-type branched-subunit amino acid transport system ATPase component
MLELRDVVKTFHGVTAIDGVTLSVPERGVFGLIGPNGAGKTTLVNLITGYLLPDAGDISFRGRSVIGMPPHRLAAAGVARTYQNLRLFETSSVRENVLIGCHLAASSGQWFRRGRAQELERRADELIERLGLVEHAADPVDELSYGLRRRVEIARALATECTLLLLDEPTAGMTAAEANGIARLIRHLAEQGVTVLLVEHNIRLVTETCDRIAVLDWGKVIAQGPPAEVWALEAVQTAYVGKRREAASR